MVTDLARRNIARVCGKLGVENIIVSAESLIKIRDLRNDIAHEYIEEELATKKTKGFLWSQINILFNSYYVYVLGGVVVLIILIILIVIAKRKHLFKIYLKK